MNCPDCNTELKGLEAFLVDGDEIVGTYEVTAYCPNCLSDFQYHAIYRMVLDKECDDLKKIRTN